jgi:hypothetical protein
MVCFQLATPNETSQDNNQSYLCLCTAFRPTPLVSQDGIDFVGETTIGIHRTACLSTNNPATPTSLPCIKSLLLALLHYIGFLSLPNIPPPASKTTVAADFDRLLGSLSDPSLHALHAHLPPSRFRDGMFEHDAAATVRALPSSDAALATRLVAAARYDRLRRQNGNLTVTPPPPPPPVIVPVTLTSTDAAGSTAVETSLALSGATASMAAVVTATDAAGQTTLLTTFVPGIVLTDAAGQVTTAPAITPSVVTTTNAQGQTVVATITPGGGVVDSLVLETTTLPNGLLSTYTSYVSPQGTGASAPHLQSAAPPARKGLVTVSGVLLVAVAFGALML